MEIIAIASDNEQTSAHFGRCPEYTFVSIENGKIIKQEILPNPGHAMGTIPTFIKDHHANCIVCGGMGGRAQQMFAEFGITPILGVQDSIKNVIQKYLEGQLATGASLCSPGGGREYGIPRSDSHHH